MRPAEGLGHFAAAREAPEEDSEDPYQPPLYLRPTAFYAASKPAGRPTTPAVAVASDDVRVEEL